jgi:hypothetical protein
VDFIKSAAAATGIGALGLGAYAIASPLMVPVSVAMIFAGGLGWVYRRSS